MFAKLNSLTGAKKTAATGTRQATEWGQRAQHIKQDVMLEVTSAWYSLFMVTDGHSWSTMVILYLEHGNPGGSRQMLLHLIDFARCNSIIDLQVSLFDAELILIRSFSALGWSRKLSCSFIAFICFPANVSCPITLFPKQCLHTWGCYDIRVKAWCWFKVVSGVSGSFGAYFDIGLVPDLPRCDAVLILSRRSCQGDVFRWLVQRSCQRDLL